MNVSAEMLVAVSGLATAMYAIYASYNKAKREDRRDEYKTLQEQINEQDKRITFLTRQARLQMLREARLTRRVAVLEGLLLRNNIQVPPEDPASAEEAMLERAATEEEDEGK